MKTYKLIAIAALTFLAARSNAQTAPLDTASMFAAKKFTFDAGLTYMSNLTYAGRRDESSVPILLPTFTAVYKQDLFLNAAAYADVNGAKSGAEGFSISPGYLFSLDTGKKITGTIIVTKFFITSNSPIILSSFNFLVDGQISYNGPVKATLGATFIVDKDNKRDLINTAEVSKEIWLFKTDILGLNGLKINPTITTYGGTQEFTETYYENSQVPRAIADPALISPISTLFPGLSKQQILNKTITQQKQREVKQYKLLAVSGSLPVTYSYNKWQFSFTPYITRPFNQVDYTGSGTTGNYFFFTAGVSYTF